MNQQITRKKPAAPISWLMQNNIIHRGNNILHFGCGKDKPGTELLAKYGTITDYDPNIPDKSTIKLKHFDTIVSCFVLNCLLPAARQPAIKQISEKLLPNGSAFIAVRSVGDSNLKVKQAKWKPVDDGFQNNKNLFQKFYTSEDLLLELKKYFKTAFILNNQNGYILAQASNIKLPKPSIKYGIGKQMVGCVYIHKTSAQILPEFNKIKKHIPKNYDYEIVKFNWLKNTFSFIQSPDFNSAPEPSVGNSLIVNPRGKTKTIKAPVDPWIYHHKWLMVSYAYRGFNTSLSKSNSLRWMRFNPDRTKIGKKSYWDKQVIPLLSKK